MLINNYNTPVSSQKKRQTNKKNKTQNIIKHPPTHFTRQKAKPQKIQRRKHKKKQNTYVDNEYTNVDGKFKHEQKTLPLNPVPKQGEGIQKTK